MTCDSFTEKLIDYLDGDVSDVTKAEMQDHLQVCTDCRHELEIQLSVKAQMAHMPFLECPDTVTTNVLKRIKMNRKQSSMPQSDLLDSIVNLYRGFPWRARYAAVAIVLFLGLILLYPVSQTNWSEQCTYSEAEIQQAREDISLALGYVCHYATMTDDLVKEKVNTTRLLKPIGESIDLTIKTMLNGGHNEKNNIL